MEIIILSKTVKNLDISLAKTSSQIFEIEFAKSLANFADVYIFSLQADQCEVSKNVSLFPISKKNMKYKIKELIDKNSIYTDDTKIMIFYGYDYFILKQLKWVCKRFDSRLISYTFDHHKGAIEHKKGLQHFLIDFYYKLGISQLNKIDGVILFNQEAYKEFNLNIPYMISKVGINTNEILPNTTNRTRTIKENFNIVYAGSLEKYNCIEEMIHAIKSLSLENVILNIYGTGTLKEKVVEKSANNARIKYNGLISRGELDLILQNADLLLNLRDTNHYVSKFAFPSKLIQYLSSGIPVISTRVIKDNIFSKIAFVVDDASPEKISEMITYVIENPDQQLKKSVLAREYIKENYSWNDITKEVYEFLIKI